MASDTVRLVRIFLASPGDVHAERQMAEHVVEELNAKIAPHLRLRLECLRWEKHVSPLMGRPQQVVLDQIDVTQSDIFVGILWTRFGSPTGARSSADRAFESGTEEEFMLAYSSWLTKQRPQIMFYNSTRPPRDLADIDPRQLEAVKKFMAEFRAEGGHPGLARTYQQPDEFARHLRMDLTGRLFQLQLPSSDGAVGPSALNQTLLSHGFTHLFLPTANTERDLLKSQALLESAQVTLIAHSGFSFLATAGHRFRRVVEERLKMGGSLRVLVTCPWSETAYWLAVGESERSSMEHPSGEVKDPVESIRGSDWYNNKHRAAISGYRKLRERFPEGVELRHWLYEMPATMLTTVTEGYMEPYLSVNLQDRLRHEMMTFEVRVTSGSRLLKHLHDFFDACWTRAIADHDFAGKEGFYQERLRQLLPFDK